MGIDNILVKLADERKKADGRNDSGYGISNSGELDDTQHQRRVATLSDREVLSRAAHGLNIASMTEAQQGALDVFRRRIDRLGELEIKRMEQGKLYREPAL